MTQPAHPFILTLIHLHSWCKVCILRLWMTDASYNMGEWGEEKLQSCWISSTGFPVYHDLLPYILCLTYWCRGKIATILKTAFSNCAYLITSDVFWCMSGLLTRGGGKTFSAFRNFTYLVRCLCRTARRRRKVQIIGLIVGISRSFNSIPGNISMNWTHNFVTCTAQMPR